MNLNQIPKAGNSILTLNPQIHQPETYSTIFTVEGNIGCGKSSFLKVLKKHFPEIKLIDEPVPEWQNVGGKGLNILEKYYKEPTRWGLTFLNYAIFSRIQKWKSSQKLYPNQIKISERSILADKYVFSELMKDLEFINEVQYAVYKQMYKGFNDILGNQTPGIIYLRCEPNVCYERVKKRKRNEQDEIPLEYLEKIHNKHQNWMNIQNPERLLILDTSEDFENNPQKIEDMIYKLRIFLKNINRN